MRLPQLILFGLLLGSTSPADAREPSELEQFYLELVNRARANPNGEVTRLSSETWGDDGFPASPDLNEGLSPGTITSAAKQPLAFAKTLIDSASLYSDFLLATEQFGHYENGTPTSRMTAAGFPFGGSYGTGENLALTTSSGPYPLNSDRAEDHHLNLFIDGNVASRGHRISLMNNAFREIGIAIRADSDSQSFFGPPFINDVLSTQNFAHTVGRIFVTGVIYYDNNTNSFYDVGESAGVLSLQIKNISNVTVATGTSFGSGGYSINMSGLPTGTYSLVATDSADDVDSTTFYWNNASNVKADILDPAFSAPPIIPLPGPSVLPATTNQEKATLLKKIAKLKKKSKKTKSKKKKAKLKKKLKKLNRQLLALG